MFKRRGRSGENLKKRQQRHSRREYLRGALGMKEGMQIACGWRWPLALEVALEEFEVTKGGKCETKEIWWWNEKVQKTIKEKKECFRCMHLDRSADNVEQYKVPKKTAKRVVSEKGGQMYDGLYQWFGMKEGEKDIYRMAKSRERKMMDIIQVKCIKDETERLLTKDEDIKNRWQEYFDKLFNAQWELVHWVRHLFRWP
jgi:hypothetical protein